MAKSVLVTGGTGYVAGWCILELLERGYNVRTTVRSEANETQVRASLPEDLDMSNRLSFSVADLTKDNGWDDTMQGIDYVLHVASPLGVSNAHHNPDELIGTAVNGTLRVLKAATNAGVERVVMTSAANASSPTSYTDTGVSDETLWTDPNAPGLIPYRRSKTLAEKAAWDFINQSKSHTTLTTILPGAVFGPILSTKTLNSVQIIGQLLGGKIPGIPNIGFEIVDVRDLANIHIKALMSDAAAGQRFLATGEFMWMTDIARTLREQLGAQAYKVPTRRIPDFVMRIMARFRPELREITVSLGRKHRHSIDKANRILVWQPRPPAETVVDCAKSLLDWKVV